MQMRQPQLPMNKGLLAGPGLKCEFYEDVRTVDMVAETGMYNWRL